MRDNVQIVCREITLKNTKAMTTKPIILRVLMVIAPLIMCKCVFVHIYTFTQILVQKNIVNYH